ncbi:MAG TPA: hypothetical protein DER13_01075 [Clostridiales bacterium]|jgi:hypothetical protein|nr:hypothetical protein [Clostridiales bacterium]
MNKSDLKGLWMPSERLINNKLSDKEKIILSMIIYLSKDKGYCFATNNYFSDILNVTVVSISRIINSLKKKNYIKINMNYKSNSKEIENRQIIPSNEVINRYYQNCEYTVNKNDKTDYQNCKIPINTNDKDIKRNIKNKKYIVREYSEEFLTGLYANLDTNLL